jgi:hypothetical protein
MNYFHNRAIRFPVHSVCRSAPVPGAATSVNAAESIYPVPYPLCSVLRPGRAHSGLIADPPKCEIGGPMTHLLAFACSEQIQNPVRGCLFIETTPRPRKSFCFFSGAAAGSVRNAMRLLCRAAEKTKRRVGRVFSLSAGLINTPIYGHSWRCNGILFGYKQATPNGVWDFLRPSDFGFRTSFGFRISDLGFPPFVSHFTLICSLTL